MRTCFILILLLPFKVFSQSTLKSFIKYDNISYLKNEPNKINGRNQVIAKLDYSNLLSNKVYAFAGIEFREDQADPSRNHTYIDEAYIKSIFGNFEGKIGKQKYSWGKADLINPTNYFGAYDYSDILDYKDYPINNYSFNGKYFWDNSALECVFAPSFIKSKLPNENSRWWPTLPNTITNPYYPIVGSQYLNVNYEYITDESTAKYDLNNSQVALKYSASLNGLDFSLSWFNGYKTLPDIYTQNIIDTLTYSDININTILKYNRINAFGFDLAKNIGSYGIRFESAYYLTKRIDKTKTTVDAPYCQYVLGIDRSFNSFLFGQNAYFLVQWIQEIQTPDRNIDYLVFDYNHLFRKTIMVKSDINIAEYFKFIINGFYDFKMENWVLQPGIEWSVCDGLKLNIDSNIMDGSSQSVFGMYNNNNRFQVRLKYDFSVFESKKHDVNN
ncbi:MAG: hypothetical protein HOO91_13620 [Bacteroidales bacterium]|nr:hypothetical protein [Bacteroidales bacterium]